MDEMKSLPGMWQLELSWLAQIRIEIESLEEQYEKNCSASPHVQFQCFQEALSFFGRPEFRDDYRLASPEDAPLETFNISSSRMFLQMLKFEGTWDEWEVLNMVRNIIPRKFNFSSDELVVHSSVFHMLEQIGELAPALLVQFILPLECVFLIALLLLFFDLKSVVFLVIVQLSFLIAVTANMFLFGLSLSIVTLMHLQMVPAIMIEFFSYIGYLYLFSTNPEKFSLKSKQCESRTGL
jgi:hypothetical protein